MKKVLEAELLSIAHRVLQMKNKEDVTNLYTEAKALYEKLLILKFHQDHFDIIQPPIAQEDLENYLKLGGATAADRNQMPVDLIEEESRVAVDESEELDMDRAPSTSEKWIQDQAVKIEDPCEAENHPLESVAFQEALVQEAFSEDEENSEIRHYLEDLDQEEEDGEEDGEEPVVDCDTLEADVEAELNDHLVNQGLPEEPAAALADDPFFGIDFQDIDFVRVDDVAREQEIVANTVFEQSPSLNWTSEAQLPISETDEQPERNTEAKSSKTRSINDAFSSVINVGLNDRIAFEKHLFNGSSEDFNRVLSQLNTINTLDEAHAFIDDLVKPDYNDWLGKDEYAARFIELMEKRFD